MDAFDPVVRTATMQSSTGGGGSAEVSPVGFVGSVLSNVLDSAVLVATLVFFLVVFLAVTGFLETVAGALVGSSDPNNSGAGRNPGTASVTSAPSGPRDRGEESDAAGSDPTGPPPYRPSAPSVSTPIGRDGLVWSGWVGAGPNTMVYRARVGRDTHSPTVAFKEPDEDVIPDGGERFLDAVETWDRIDDHPNVLGVLGWRTTPEPWVVVEYGDGGSLADRVGDLSLDEALWTASSIAAGVERAHDDRVTHLALCPSNVVFRETDDGWDVPKVADWRVADVLAADGTGSDETNLAYAAPEQLHEELGSPDRGTDVYAVGAICYELLTGRPPFLGGRDEVAAAKKSEPPSPPTTIDPQLPDEIDDILLSALTPDRAGRIDDVTYLRERLEGVYERVRDE